jgi:hypothetical protein
VILKTIKKIFSKNIWYFNLLDKPAEKENTQMNPSGTFQIHGIGTDSVSVRWGFRHKKGEYMVLQRCFILKAIFVILGLSIHWFSGLNQNASNLQGLSS